MNLVPGESTPIFSLMLRRPGFWFFAVVLWFVILFALSHQSRLQPPGPQFDHRDKVYHAGYFTIGATCLFLGLRLARPHWRTAGVFLLTVLLCSAMGAFDEYHQSFVPNRSGNDPGDWAADTAGGVLGSLCALGLLRTRWLKGKDEPCEP